MSILLLPKQYQDGSILRKSALDAIVTALLNFFNGPNISNGNVQAGGIETVNLDSSAQFYPLGAIVEWPQSVAPNVNWLECYGQAISRTTYASLFALIGVTYGPGDGSTTFNLPDIRGRAVVGLSTSSVALTIVNPTILGNTGGNQELADHTHGVGTATLGPLGSGHTHDVTDPSHRHTLTATDLQSYGSVGGGTNTYIRDLGNVNVDLNSTDAFNFANSVSASATIGNMAPETMHTHMLIGTTGSTGVSNNGSMQPTIVNDYIMRVS